MDADLKEYLGGRDYLPDFLKDFHDQKDVFKLIDGVISRRQEAGGSPHLVGYNWVMAHVYTIDFFLWCMAFYGYKLQKTHKRGVRFGSLEADLKAEHERRMELLKADLDSAWVPVEPKGGDQ